MGYNRKDYFFKKAKEQNYAARSVFKLEEMDARFKLLRPGLKVLDLGAAPGSWSQYASQKIGPQGRVLAVDLQEVGLTLPNVAFVRSDIRQIQWDHVFNEFGIKPPFDVVLSDMAPKTTGIRDADQARSAELCRLALEIANRYLKPSGHLIVKLFHSGEFEAFRAELKKQFERVEVLRPKSTRTESKEIFLLGLKLRPNGNSPETSYP